MRANRTSRGFTLVELMVTVGLISIVMTLAVSAAITIDRGRRPRALLAVAQGEGRQGLAFLEAELRIASMGVGTGIVRTAQNGNAISRPAVQIFDNLAGGGFLEAKAGTDALLLVLPVPNAAAAVSDPPGSPWAAPAALAADAIWNAEPYTLVVTDTSAFADNALVLVGDYGNAVWAPIAAVNKGQRELKTGLNVPVLPDTQANKIAAGSAVHLARARLYFVNVRDELVRADLRVPYAPSSIADVAEAQALVTGVENLQLDCAIEANNAFAACPPALAAGNAVSDEAAPSLGGGGARFDPAIPANAVSALRTVALGVVVRSREKVTDDTPADAPVTLNGVTLTASGHDVDPSARYLRRAYQIGVAVRNTSLGAL
jgi:prepilin-type N-terminal cleavage/methylation domain-containing protein